MGNRSFVLALCLLLTGCFATSTTITNSKQKTLFKRGWYSLSVENSSAEPIDDTIMNVSEKISCHLIFDEEVLLCLFQNTSDLSNIFGYATYHIEGNDSIQSIKRLKKENRSLPLYGTNLSVSAIKNYLGKMRRHCCLTEGEKLLVSLVDWNEQQRKKFKYIISSSIHRTLTVKHELLHAIFYKDDDYREKVNRFWQIHVSENDKKNIRQAFVGAYDLNNDYMVIDEFQAHMLFSTGNLLGSYKEKFRIKFLEYVSEISSKYNFPK